MWGIHKSGVEVDIDRLVEQLEGLSDMEGITVLPIGESNVNAGDYHVNHPVNKPSWHGRLKQEESADEGEDETIYRCGR